MKRNAKKFASFLTAVCLGVTQLAAPVPALGAPVALFPSEVKTPSGFQLHLPSELGTIQTQFSGNGPLLIHLQTAHGNYEAQKRIQAILTHLNQAYGIKHLFLEGSAFKLRPELLRFYPDRADLTRKILDELARKAFVKAPELFLAEAEGAEAYGIENLEAYVLNGKSFAEVLTERQKTEKFLEEADLQIKRLTSPHLSQDLRAFLRRLETFEASQIPLLDWLGFLRVQAQKHLEIDLTRPAEQIDWPMLVRIYKLQEFELKIDFGAFEKEKKKFLSAIRRFVPAETYREIEKFFSSPLSQHSLPDPETGLLFEQMVSHLPPNFNYRAFPNVNLFIGHLILQSELKGERLFEEIEKLSDRIQEKLAEGEAAKKIVALLKDHRLLKRLLALELTPRDYEKVLGRSGALRPEKFLERFEGLNKEKRVRGLNFPDAGKIQPLFEKALEFYAGAKERDRWLTENLVKKMQELGAAKAVVVTGGFHAEPFKKFFAERGFNYALISPTLTAPEGGAAALEEGREAYLESVLNTRLDGKEVKTSTWESVPFVATGRAQLREMGVDERKVVPVVAEAHWKILSQEGIVRSPRFDLPLEFNKTAYAREYGLLDLARELTFGQMLPKPDTTLQLADGTTVASGRLSRSETRTAADGGDWYFRKFRAVAANPVVKKPEDLLSRKRLLEEEIERLEREREGNWFLRKIALTLQPDLDPIHQRKLELETLDRKLAALKNETRSEVRGTTPEILKARGALNRAAQPYFSFLLQEGRDEEPHGEAPTVFVVLGNPDFRSILEFTKRWKKLFDGKGYPVPIVLAGGQGRGTLPLFDKMIEHYKMEWGKLTKFEEEALKRRRTTMRETELLEFILEKEGITEKALKGFGRFIHKERKPSSRTAKNFENTEDVLKEIVNGRAHPVIAIVHSPPLLLRAKSSAEKAWEKEVNDKDQVSRWNVKKFKTYRFRLEEFSDSELIYWLGYLAGYPEAYRKKYPKLNGSNELKGYYDVTLVPEKKRDMKGLARLQAAFKKFLDLYEINYVEEGEHRALVPVRPRSEVRMGKEEAQRILKIVENQKGAWVFEAREDFSFQRVFDAMSALMEVPASDLIGGWLVGVGPGQASRPFSLMEAHTYSDIVKQGDEIRATRKQISPPPAPVPASQGSDSGVRPSEASSSVQTKDPKVQVRSWISTLRESRSSLEGLEGAASALAYHSEFYKEDTDLTTDVVLALLTVLERHREPEAAWVREDVLWALEEIGPRTRKIVPTMTEALFKIALSDSSPYVRAKSWQVLVKFYAEDVERILKNGNQNTFTPEDQRALLITYKNLEPGDPKRQQIFDALLVQNKRLPVVIAGQMAKQGQDKLDYAQEGILGLRKAIKRFDFSRGQDFPAYAGTVIRRTIQRYRAATRKGMAIPQYELARLHEVNGAVERWKHEYRTEPTRQEWDEIVLQLALAKEIEKAVERWRKDHGQDPSAEEMGGIKTEAALSPWIEEFHKTIRRTLQAATLRHISDEESSLDEAVQQTTFLDPAESLEEVPEVREEEAVIRYREVLRKLSPKEILVLKLRNGVGTKERKGYGLKEIAAVLGVKRQRVHQIETTAKEKAQKKLREEESPKEIPAGILDHTDVFLFETYGIVADEEILSLERKRIERRIQALLEKGATLQQLRDEPRLLLGEGVRKIIRKKSGSVLVPVDEGGRFRLNGEIYHLGPEFAGKIVIATYDESTGKFVVRTDTEKPASPESAPPVTRSEVRKASGVSRRTFLGGIGAAAAAVFFSPRPVEAQEIRITKMDDLVARAEAYAEKAFVRQEKTDIPELDNLDPAKAAGIRGAEVFNTGSRIVLAGPRKETDWRALKIYRETKRNSGNYRELPFDPKLVDYSEAGLAAAPDKKGQYWVDLSFQGSVPENPGHLPVLYNADGNAYERDTSLGTRGDQMILAASFRPFIQQGSPGTEENFPELREIFVATPTPERQVIYQMIENEDAVMLRQVELTFKKGETLRRVSGVLIPRKGRKITAEMNIGMGVSSMLVSKERFDSDAVKVTYANGQAEAYAIPEPEAAAVTKEFAHPKHGNPVTWSIEERTTKKKPSYFISNVRWTLKGKPLPTKTKVTVHPSRNPNDDNVVVATTLAPEKPIEGRDRVLFSYDVTVKTATEAPASKMKVKEEEKIAGPREEVKVGNTGVVRQEGISAEKMKQIEGKVGFIYEAGSGDFGGVYAELELSETAKGPLFWKWQQVEGRAPPEQLNVKIEHLDGKLIDEKSFAVNLKEEAKLVLSANTPKRFRFVLINEAKRLGTLNKSVGLVAESFSASRSEVRNMLGGLEFLEDGTANQIFRSAWYGKMAYVVLLWRQLDAGPVQDGNLAGWRLIFDFFVRPRYSVTALSDLEEPAGYKGYVGLKFDEKGNLKEWEPLALNDRRKAELPWLENFLTRWLKSQVGKPFTIQNPDLGIDPQLLSLPRSEVRSKVDEETTEIAAYQGKLLVNMTVKEESEVRRETRTFRVGEIAVPPTESWVPDQKLEEISGKLGKRKVVDAWMESGESLALALNDGNRIVVTSKGDVAEKEPQAYQYVKPPATKPALGSLIEVKPDKIEKPEERGGISVYLGGIKIAHLTSNASDWIAEHVTMDMNELRGERKIIDVEIDPFRNQIELILEDGHRVALLNSKVTFATSGTAEDLEKVKTYVRLSPPRARIVFEKRKREATRSEVRSDAPLGETAPLGAEHWLTMSDEERWHVTPGRPLQINVKKKVDPNRKDLTLTVVRFTGDRSGRILAARLQRPYGETPEEVARKIAAFFDEEGIDLREEGTFARLVLKVQFVPQAAQKAPEESGVEERAAVKVGGGQPIEIQVRKKVVPGNPQPTQVEVFFVWTASEKDNAVPVSIERPLSEGAEEIAKSIAEKVPPIEVLNFNNHFEKFWELPVITGLVTPPKEGSGAAKARGPETILELIPPEVVKWGGEFQKASKPPTDSAGMFQAAKKLGEMGPRAIYAVSILKEGMLQDDRTVRAAIVEALENIVVDSRENLRLSRELLIDEKVGVRNFPISKKWVEKRIGFLSHEDPEVRVLAAANLGRIYTSLKTEPSSKGTTTVILGQAILAFDDAIQGLIKNLEDPYSSVREAAADALSQIGPASAQAEKLVSADGSPLVVSALAKRVVEDPSEKVTLMAQKALEQIDPAFKFAADEVTKAKERFDKTARNVLSQMKLQTLRVLERIKEGTAEEEADGEDTPALDLALAEEFRVGQLSGAALLERAGVETGEIAPLIVELAKVEERIRTTTDLETLEVLELLYDAPGTPQLNSDQTQIAREFGALTLGALRIHSLRNISPGELVRRVITREKLSERVKEAQAQLQKETEEIRKTIGLSNVDTLEVLLVRVDEKERDTVKLTQAQLDRSHEFIALLPEELRRIHLGKLLRRTVKKGGILQALGERQREREAVLEVAERFNGIEDLDTLRVLVLAYNTPTDSDFDPNQRALTEALLGSLSQKLGETAPKVSLGPLLRRTLKYDKNSSKIEIVSDRIDELLDQAVKKVVPEALENPELADLSTLRVVKRVAIFRQIREIKERFRIRAQLARDNLGDELLYDRFERAVQASLPAPVNRLSLGELLERAKITPAWISNKVEAKENAIVKEEIPRLVEKAELPTLRVLRQVLGGHSPKPGGDDALLLEEFMSYLNPLIQTPDLTPGALLERAASVAGLTKEWYGSKIMDLENELIERDIRGAWEKLKPAALLPTLRILKRILEESKFEESLKPESEEFQRVSEFKSLIDPLVQTLSARMLLVRAGITLGQLSAMIEEKEAAEKEAAKTERIKEKLPTIYSKSDLQGLKALAASAPEVQGKEGEERDKAEEEVRRKIHLQILRALKRVLESPTPETENEYEVKPHIELFRNLLRQDPELFRGDPDRDAVAELQISEIFRRGEIGSDVLAIAIGELEKQVGDDILNRLIQGKVGETIDRANLPTLKALTLLLEKPEVENSEDLRLLIARFRVSLSLPIVRLAQKRNLTTNDLLVRAGVKREHLISKIAHRRGLEETATEQDIERLEKEGQELGLSDPPTRSFTKADVERAKRAVRRGLPVTATDAEIQRVESDATGLGLVDTPEKSYTKADVERAKRAKKRGLPVTATDDEIGAVEREGTALGLRDLPGKPFTQADVVQARHAKKRGLPATASQAEIDTVEREGAELGLTDDPAQNKFFTQADVQRGRRAKKRGLDPVTATEAAIQDIEWRGRKLGFIDYPQPFTKADVEQGETAVKRGLKATASQTEIDEVVSRGTALGFTGDFTLQEVQRGEKAVSLGLEARATEEEVERAEAAARNPLIEFLRHSDLGIQSLARELLKKFLGARREGKGDQGPQRSEMRNEKENLGSRLEPTIPIKKILAFVAEPEVRGRLDKFLRPRLPSGVSLEFKASQEETVDHLARNRGGTGLLLMWRHPLSREADNLARAIRESDNNVPVIFLSPVKPVEPLLKNSLELELHGESDVIPSEMLPDVIGRLVARSRAGASQREETSPATPATTTVLPPKEELLPPPVDKVDTFEAPQEISLADLLEIRLRHLGLRPEQVDQVQFGAFSFSQRGADETTRSRLIEKIQEQGLQVLPGMEIKIHYGAARSEVRRSEVRVEQILRPEVKIVATQYTAKLLRERFRDSHPEIFGVLVRGILGPEALAAEAIAQMIPVLPQSEIASLGIVHSFLTSPSQNKRRVFDYRSLPSEPSELDPVLLYSLSHREVGYTLLVVAPEEKVAGFTGELRRYVESRYQSSLPSNFKVVGVPTRESLIPTLHDLVSEAKTPGGFVTEDESLAREIAYRRGLLRVIGSRDSAVQNATTLLTAERLLGEVPFELFIRILTGKELDLQSQWEELVATLRSREAFLRAA